MALQLMDDKELSDLSNMFGPVLRGWGQLLRSIPSEGAETIVEACERLLGALDAAET
jgi:hypothetical protein